MTEKKYIKPEMRVLMAETESDILGASVFNPELQDEETDESWSKDMGNYDVWEQ